MTQTLLSGRGFTTLDPSDSLVLTWDWTSLPVGVTIALSTFTLKRLLPSPQTVTSITRVGGTATVTTTAAHGYLTNDWITIAGADQADYNLTAQVTVTGLSTFTYTVANAPTTPATGTITASFGIGKDSASILAGSRSTQIRLLAGGDRALGTVFEAANTIVTSETPAQTKERSIQVLVEQL